MLESENNHYASRGIVSRYLIRIKVIFIVMFLFPGLPTYGQNSIDRFFLKVEQRSDGCTLHYIAEDNMYDANPHQLTVGNKWRLSNDANADEMKMMFNSFSMMFKGMDEDQSDESSVHKKGNKDIRFSAGMDLIRIDAPYPIYSVSIKSAGGKMFYLESEVAGQAFTLDLSGFDSGFYTLEISARKPRH